MKNGDIGRGVRATGWGLAALLIAAACSTGESGPGSPVPTIPASVPPAEFHIPGFEVELEEIVTGQPQRVIMEPVPEIFENQPAAVAFPTMPTSEGNMAAGALAEAVGATFPVRNLVLRPLGDWLAYAIRNDKGAWVATRLATPREGPGLPALLALEAASAATAEPVRISGPAERHADTSSGIVFYPPLEVKVRGQPGIYLHQELERVEPLPSALPVCTLIWREGDVYWRLSGICASSPRGQYDLFSLLDVVSYMTQYDPESGRWVTLDRR